MQVLRQFIERLTARATFPVLVAAMLAAFGLGSVGVSNAVAAVMAALITVTVTVVTVVYTATTTVTAVV